VSDRIDWPPAGVVTLCRWLLARAAEALPPQRRADWLAEWEGELWALWTRGVGPCPYGRGARGPYWHAADSVALVALAARAGAAGPWHRR
jgi:hypothetical protein